VVNSFKKPKSIVQKTSTDRALDWLGIVAVLSVWILTAFIYADLPQILPIHYNILGNPDGYGTKTHVLALPIVSTLLYVGLSILNGYPHIFNYPVLITENNASYHYTLATRFIRYLKFILVLIFEFIIYNIASQSHFRIWFLPSILALIFIPLLFYLYKAKYSSPA
jgi:uncharacterized membrane protein